MKKTTRDNYRLEVFPDLDILLTDDATRDAMMRAALRDIKADILRHVDGIHRVVPKWDTREECSHCDRTWEVLTAAQADDPRSRIDERSIEGEPLCCDEAIYEFRIANNIKPHLSELEVSTHDQ